MDDNASSGPGPRGFEKVYPVGTSSTLLDQMNERHARKQPPPGPIYASASDLERPAAPPADTLTRKTRTIRVPEDVGRKLAVRFTTHELDEQQREVVETIRELASGFVHFIVAMCPNGREGALAVTKIEEAMFWAVAAAARPQV